MASILIVSEDPLTSIYRTFFGSMANQGVEIVEASTAQRGLDQVTQREFDLIITDAGLAPGHDWADEQTKPAYMYADYAHIARRFVRLARTSERNSKTLIAVMTLSITIQGSRQTNDERTMLEAGADRYFYMPSADKQEVWDELKGMMGYRQ